MAELTQEQVERAARQLIRISAAGTWEEASPAYRHVLELSVRAAAPFLQLPWDTPTIEEATKANWCMDGQSAIFDFLRRRNAALMPKPVDPRVALVEQVISRGRMHISADQKTLAVEIVAALDARSVAASQSDDHGG